MDTWLIVLLVVLAVAVVVVLALLLSKRSRIAQARKFCAAEAGTRLDCEVVQGYGMTELSPVTHATPSGDFVPGSVGVTVPNTELRIVDVETGADLGVDRDGERAGEEPEAQESDSRRHTERSRPVSADDQQRLEGDPGRRESREARGDSREDEERGRRLGPVEARSRRARDGEVDPIDRDHEEERSEERREAEPRRSVREGEVRKGEDDEGPCGGDLAREPRGGNAENGPPGPERTAEVGRGDADGGPRAAVRA